MNKNLVEKLIKIQGELNAPKNLKNNFGGYNYRNVEGIFEAVKPLLKKEGLVLFLTDDVVEKQDRLYIKSTATITDGESKIEAIGYARESSMKKGMDDAQITGSCSSYARKYALGGLFLIDDNKDIDEPDEEIPENNKNLKHVEEKEVKKNGKIIPSENNFADKAIVNKMIAEFAKIGIKESDLLSYFNIEKEKITNKDMKVLREYFLEKKQAQANVA